MGCEDAPTYQQLVSVFDSTDLPYKGELLIAEIEENKDFYNPALIVENGKRYLAIRVESRRSHWLNISSYDPKIQFFVQNDDGVWKQEPQTPTYDLLEDPFSTWFVDENGQKKLLFGGVGIDRTGEFPQIVTKYFIGQGIHDLPQEPAFEILGMKDIRVIQDPQTLEFYVLTRPQNNEFGPGRIGVCKINNLTDLTAENIKKAHIFHCQVSENTRIGSNELYWIEIEGVKCIGVLGHIAYEAADGSQHYSAMIFALDQTSPETTEEGIFIPKIIADRQVFPACESKTEILDDVVFPGSIDFINDDLVILFTGLSDARIGTLKMKNPFQQLKLK